MNARARFEHAARADFTDLPADTVRFLGLAFCAETCAALGDQQRAETLYALLLPHAERHVVISNGRVYYDPVSRLLGLLASTRKRWAEADAHFSAASAVLARMEARPRLAWTQCDHAAMQKFAAELARQGKLRRGAPLTALTIDPADVVQRRQHRCRPSRFADAEGVRGDSREQGAERAARSRRRAPAADDDRRRARLGATACNPAPGCPAAGSSGSRREQSHPRRPDRSAPDRRRGTTAWCRRSCAGRI